MHLYKKQYDIWRQVYAILVMRSFIPNLGMCTSISMHSLWMNIGVQIRNVNRPDDLNDQFDRGLKMTATINKHY
jgi:hypothetical protein